MKKYMDLNNMAENKDKQPEDIINCAVPLQTSDIIALKAKSKETSTKAAITAAVRAYLRGGK